MAEDGKLKIDSMMVMISVSVRCRSKTLYIRRSFRSLWQKSNLQIRAEWIYIGQEAEQKHVEIKKDRRDKVQAKYHVLELQPEGPLSESIFEACSLQGWFGEAEEAFLHNVSEDKETAETRAGVAFGVAERLSRTFRVESTGIRAEAPKMLWADSVSTTYLIYGIPYVLIWFRIPEEEWQGKDTSRTLEVFDYDHDLGALQDSGNQMKNTQKTDHPPTREAPRLHRYEDPLESPGLQASGFQGLKKSRMASKGTRLELVDLKGFPTENGRTLLVPGLRHGRVHKPKWQLPLVFEMKNRCSEKHVLRYSRQFGDEREVEVLRNFNRPPSELITEDGVLPEKGYSQFNDVSSGYLVSKVS
ncbi:hypothetical protein Tco_0833514 [Tanacetum coccineum]